MGILFGTHRGYKLLTIMLFAVVIFGVFAPILNVSVAHAVGHNIQGAIPEGSVVESAIPHQGDGDPSPGPCEDLGYGVADLGLCLVRYFFVGIGTLFMLVTGSLLVLAGTLFNVLIKFTITNFDGNIYFYVKDGIELAWGAFRDIANIAIIGAFVFVAISTILSIESYGVRQFIAKILIAAVLINFSLLFTKLIIDASNFTALQFAQSMPGVDYDDDTGPSVPDISGAFMNAAGVSSITDSYGMLSKHTSKAGGMGGWSLMYGLFASFMFIAVAAVLLYGSFLLATRAILFIVLLLTSALAFASFAIPKLKGMGWDTWWKALLQNAFLAPLLMVLLWASAHIAQVLLNGVASGEEGSLGSMIAEPMNTDLVSLFVYFVIIIGLLYASMKISSGFSKQITGFSTASLPASFTGALSVAAGGRAGGRVGRNVVGKYAAERAERYGEEAREARERGDAKGINSATKWQRRMTTLAKSDFNFANTKVGKKATGNAGLKGKFAGETKIGGWLGQQKKAAQPYADQANKVGKDLSKDEHAKIGEHAKNAAADEVTKILHEARGGMGSETPTPKSTTPAASPESTTPTSAGDAGGETKPSADIPTLDNVPRVGPTMPIPQKDEESSEQPKAEPKAEAPREEASKAQQSSEQESKKGGGAPMDSVRQSKEYQNVAQGYNKKIADIHNTHEKETTQLKQMLEEAHNQGDGEQKISIEAQISDARLRRENQINKETLKTQEALKNIIEKELKFRAGDKEAVIERTAPPQLQKEAIKQVKQTAKKGRLREIIGDEGKEVIKDMAEEATKKDEG